MLKDKEIRLATEGDNASILQIYAPYITDTVISFECQVPNIVEFSERMENIQRRYPWLVCEINDNIVGYAYASRFSEREAYNWSADFSVYINPQYHRRNIGTALYFALFELLKLQGYYNVYAGVTLPNIKSQSLHESFGFKAIGVYQNVGYKFGSWHDVKWYGLKIKEPIQSPIKPKSIDEISDTIEFKTIIGKAEQIMDKSNLKRNIYPMPEFVSETLMKEDLMNKYLERPPYQQNDYIGWITRAKRPETVQKRLNQMITELHDEDKYMGMDYKMRK